MQNKLMNNRRMKFGSMLGILCNLIVLYSCQQEKELLQPMGEEGSQETDIATLTPKLLATVQLTNGHIVTFRSEVDGVIYEEEGSSTEELGILENFGILERFLLLTPESVAVPQDLIDLETDQEIKDRALTRGTVERHNVEIMAPAVATQSDANAKALASGSWCSGSPNYRYDTDAYGQYYRTFRNHSWGIAGTTVYSSTKSGGGKCKTVNLYLVNCTNSNTLLAETWYKNIYGNYKKQNSIKVDPSKSRFWAKTYTSKRYRRVGVSGFGSSKFGGYVLFNNY